MQTMKAAVIRRYGPPETISVARVPVPEPKAKEIRVAMKASCATAASAMMRSGTPRYARLFLGLRGPSKPIPGSGFAGIVEKVGPGVTGFAVGDAVFGETAAEFGTNAERICIATDHLVLPKPDSLSFEEAAAMCDGPLTSWNFLVNIGKVRPGQRVLVIGAAGSLGSAAVQIARARGAHVTGVASAANTAFVTGLGADAVIDYRRTDPLSTGPYDLIYDAVGAASFKASRAALARDGQFLTPVLKLSMLCTMLTNRFRAQTARFDATGLKKPHELRPMMADLLALVAAGDLRVPITRTFPLDQIVAAHRLIDTGHKQGNIVIAA